MSVLDKKLLLQDLEAQLNEYIPANTVKRILADAGNVLENYEVTTIIPDGGGSDESIQLIKLFVDAKAIEGKSPTTLARYEYVLRRLYEGVKVPLRRVTVYHLRQYMMAEKERGVALTTIKGNGSIYNAFYGWLHGEGIIQANPTTNLGAIRAKPEEEPPFSEAEIQLIKEACENDLERAVVFFLLSTGCRISELCGVDRGDVDFQNLKLKVNGKGDKERWVYIDDVTAMMLKRYLSERKDIDPALFRSRRGRFTPNGLRRMLKKLEERSHVAGIHPHRFRHTFATALVDRGMQIQEVSALLGHAKLDTTMVYVTVNQRNTENSYRRYACL